MKKVSFVIPCYKSALTIEGVIQEIKETMASFQEKYSYEVILVNDFPEDGTFDVIREITAENENIIGVNLAKNFGQHAALMAGFHYCSGDITVCLDDDGQNPPEEMFSIIDKLEEGYDGYLCDLHDEVFN